jgi:hypothetical protein
MALWRRSRPEPEPEPDSVRFYVWNESSRPIEVRVPAAGGPGEYAPGETRHFEYTAGRSLDLRIELAPGGLTLEFPGAGPGDVETRSYSVPRRGRRRRETTTAPALFTLINSSGEQREVALEPLGYLEPLPPGSSLQAEYLDVVHPDFGLALGDEAITLWEEGTGQWSELRFREP